MTEHWKSFLTQQGAVFTANSTVQHFGNPNDAATALTQNICSDLSQFAVLHVVGADAEKFLQGQFTNDVRHVKTEKGQLGAWCSAKGRILVNFRLLAAAEGYYLMLPKLLLENVLKRLRMFVLRSAVTLTDVSDSVVRLGVAGAEALGHLEKMLGVAMPTEQYACVHHADFIIMRIEDAVTENGVHLPRVIVLGASAAMENVWNTLKLTPVGQAGWELLEILAGVPHILPATVDEFVPQMVNFQILNGVNFKKGCYAGQEIVARMQYLGSLKRRMYLVKLQGDSAPLAGDNLYPVNQPDAQSVGKIVNAVATQDGQALGLAVVQIEQAEQVPLAVGKNQVEFLNLPYLVEVA